MSKRHTPFNNKEQESCKQRTSDTKSNTQSCIHQVYPVYTGSDKDRIQKYPEVSRSIQIVLDPIHFYHCICTGTDLKLFAFTRDRIRIESKSIQIVLDPIHFYHCVCIGSDLKLFAFTRDRIQQCIHSFGPKIE